MGWRALRRLGFVVLGAVLLVVVVYGLMILWAVTFASRIE